jgi:hypothetical protein
LSRLAIQAEKLCKTSIGTLSPFTDTDAPFMTQGRSGPGQ